MLMYFKNLKPTFLLQSDLRLSRKKYNYFKLFCIYFVYTKRELNIKTGSKTCICKRSSKPRSKI